MEGAPDAQQFEQSFHIGRDSANDIVVDDVRVSTRHATVSLIDGKWFIEDLDSSNGTFVEGERITRYRLSGTKKVRLGFDGPRLELTVGGDQDAPRSTVISQPSESQVLDRLLGEDAPADMSRHTRLLRQVLRKDRSRLARRYLVALAAITAVALIAIVVVYAQRKQLERARLAAAEVFYAMKALELEVDQLQLDPAEIREYRQQQEEMRQTYLDYLQDLGV